MTIGYLQAKDVGREEEVHLLDDEELEAIMENCGRQFNPISALR